MKIVFMGTPSFALPSLQLLYYADAFDILAVITQPDRPAGRGNKVISSPVKDFATRHEITTYQPEKIKKDKELIEILKNLKPDMLVTVAFGQILSKEILEIPPFGTINLHASMLPKYRGANPIQWAIINGDERTGVTTMITEESVDSGDMLMSQDLPILIDYDTKHLSRLMASLGSRILGDTLVAFYEGSLKPVKQNHNEATMAPMLKKEMGKIDWSKSTWTIHNLIRGTKPWPGAYTYFKGDVLKIHTSFIPPIKDEPVQSQPGMIKRIAQKFIQVYTGDTYIDIIEVQPSNKPILNAGDWARGARLTTKDMFSFDLVK